MLRFGFCLALQFRDDALCQHLAKFDTPLVKGINVPDGALSKDTVFVECNQLAERFRCELVGEDCVRWTIALEDAMRDEPVRCAVRFHLLGRLAERQRLGLGEDIRQEYVVMPAKGVECSVERDKVTRDELGPLMDQLIERVLAVGSRFAPVYGAR